MIFDTVGRPPGLVTAEEDSEELSPPSWNETLLDFGFIVDLGDGGSWEVLPTFASTLEAPLRSS
jgi:hypothetical protein